VLLLLYLTFVIMCALSQYVQSHANLNLTNTHATSTKGVVIFQMQIIDENQFWLVSDDVTCHM